MHLIRGCFIFLALDTVSTFGAWLGLLAVGTVYVVSVFWQASQTAHATVYKAKEENDDKK